MRLLSCFAVLYFGIALTLKASIPVVLDDTTHSVRFLGNYIDYLEDKDDKITFAMVAGNLAKEFITANPGEVVNNNNLNSAYWTRLTILNNSTESRRWVVELFDHKIDYYEAYLPNEKGGFDKFVGGAKYEFNKKIFNHKNFIHNLHCHPGKSVQAYFKIKSNGRIVFIGVIRTIERLVEYSNKEYFLLSLFYGIVIAIVLYNFFLFISTNDFAYLFYVLYVTSIGFLALNKDGIGFQYLWHTHPEWNEPLPLISSFSTICWAVLYAREFLNTKKLLPLLDKIAIGILLIRAVLFLLAFYFPIIATYTWIDVFPLLYVYGLGIVAWLYGNSTARFYVLAFTLFFVGFSLAIINEFWSISSRPLVIYGFNIGVLCEMLLLSFALSDRIKILTQQNNESQQKLIIQSQENESLKDKINSELESKVLERTIALEEKNKELDHFVYRASHDIKGPLKSIMGLTMVGMQDVQDPTIKNYFEHILKSSRRLDFVVEHLLHVIETKDLKIIVTEIDWHAMLQDIFSSMKHLPWFSIIEQKVSIHGEQKLYTDEKLLYAIVQNLIENSLRYREMGTDNPFLKINIAVDQKRATIDIIDNGPGIDKSHQEKIFDMFYKVNPESAESGLGLYMTKLYVEQLGGSIRVISKLGHGTTFSIKLANHISSKFQMEG